jgi:hypothetical protein
MCVCVSVSARLCLFLCVWRCVCVCAACHVAPRATMAAFCRHFCQSVFMWHVGICLRVFVSVSSGIKNNVQNDTRRLQPLTRLNVKIRI